MNEANDCRVNTGTEKHAGCEKDNIKRRSIFFFKIKQFFFRLFYRKRRDSWIDQEVSLAIANEKKGTDEKDSKDDVFLRYSIACIKNAGEIAQHFYKQGHSGLSASITLSLIKKLCAHQPIAPLTGDDNEWNVLDYTYPEECHKMYQNNRDCRVFKRINKDGTIEYSQNVIIDVVNEDDIWKWYPPVDDPGTLDDDNDDVKRYFSMKKDLISKHNSKIKFPYIGTTYKYKWDFEAMNFILIE